MSEVERAYNEHFKESFEDFDLLLYECKDSYSKFKNNHFKFQIFYDRGLFESSISSLYGTEKFIGIELLSAFFKLTSNKSLSPEDRKRILRTRLSFKDQAVFIVDNFSKISSLLDEDNFKDTLSAIRFLDQEI